MREVHFRTCVHLYYMYTYIDIGLSTQTSACIPCIHAYAHVCTPILRFQGFSGFGWKAPSAAFHKTSELKESRVRSATVAVQAITRKV